MQSWSHTLPKSIYRNKWAAILPWWRLLGGKQEYYLWEIYIHLIHCRGNKALMLHSYHVHSIYPSSTHSALSTWHISYKPLLSSATDWSSATFAWLLDNEIHKVEQQIQILLLAACQYIFSIFCNKYGIEILTEIPTLALSVGKLENLNTV